MTTNIDGVDCQVEEGTDQFRDWDLLSNIDRVQDGRNYHVHTFEKRKSPLLSIIQGIGAAVATPFLVISLQFELLNRCWEKVFTSLNQRAFVAIPEITAAQFGILNANLTALKELGMSKEAAFNSVREDCNFASEAQIRAAIDFVMEDENPERPQEEAPIRVGMGPVLEVANIEHPQEVQNPNFLELTTHPEGMNQFQKGGLAACCFYAARFLAEEGPVTPALIQTVLDDNGYLGIPSYVDANTALDEYDVTDFFQDSLNVAENPLMPGSGFNQMMFQTEVELQQVLNALLESDISRVLLTGGGTTIAMKIAGGNFEIFDSHGFGDYTGGDNAACIVKCTREQACEYIKRRTSFITLNEPGQLSLFQ